MRHPELTTDLHSDDMANTDKTKMTTIRPFSDKSNERGVPTSPPTR